MQMKDFYKLLKKRNLRRASALEKGKKNITMFVVVTGDREETKVGDR